jgi:hypothetical protein
MLFGTGYHGHSNCIDNHVSWYLQYIQKMLVFLIFYHATWRPQLIFWIFTCMYMCSPVGPIRPLVHYFTGPTTGFIGSIVVPSQHTSFYVQLAKSSFFFCFLIQYIYILVLITLVVCGFLYNLDIYISGLCLNQRTKREILLPRQELLAGQK